MLERVPVEKQKIDALLMFSAESIHKGKTYVQVHVNALQTLSLHSREIGFFVQSFLSHGIKVHCIGNNNNKLFNLFKMPLAEITYRTLYKFAMRRSFTLVKASRVQLLLRSGSFRFFPWFTCRNIIF